LFRNLKQKARRSHVVGVDLYDDGCALVVVDPAAGSPRVVGARWCAFDGVVPNEEHFRDAVRDLGARGLKACATLRHASYSLVQLEAPDIPDDELDEAMRWRVGDLVDFPVEDAIVDVFKLPPSRRPGALPLLYVVVAKLRDVDELAQMLLGAGLQVDAIDIVEMAIRNLSLHVDAPNRPRAYLHMQAGQTVIEIADGPQVYLSRRVLQDYDADADPVVLQAQMENLALEVQRSLDYFESQYALGAVDQLSVIARDAQLYASFSRVAESFLTVKAEPFDLARITTDADVNLQVLGRGMTAIGAAMRSLPWAA
jgi:MSHA biogenesis protein MshI